MNNCSPDIKIKMFSAANEYYEAMLRDIGSAQKYVYLEYYRFRNDTVGEVFRNLLIEKQQAGIRVRVLIDAWAAASDINFFKDLIKAGGEVKFFKKLRISWAGFTRGHRRNHRKIIVVDDTITYIGSANIVDYAMNWRESVFRLEGPIAKKFKKIIELNFRIYNKYFYNKRAYTRSFSYDELIILRDVPSNIFRPIKRQLLKLIRNAKKEIFIETPYFLPPFTLRKALTNAAKRGVNVNVIVPQKSDVGLIDVLNSRYVGLLARQGVNFYFYVPQNLHSKIFLADNKTFLIGSANIDYRSFRHTHEIGLAGKHEELASQIAEHFSETMRQVEPFNFEKWAKRSLFQRVFERLLIPFRRLF
jgi:cardiolipin synthase